MPETNRIAYKSALTKDLDLEKAVVAFLNYHEGGLVYIGIDKMGATLGVVDPDSDMLKIKDRIKVLCPVHLPRVVNIGKTIYYWSYEER